MQRAAVWHWWWWWWCRASCPRMLGDILETNCDQCRSMLQCCFTSTETMWLIRTESPGRPPRLSHSSWALYGTGTHHILQQNSVHSFFIVLIFLIFILVLINYQERLILPACPGLVCFLKTGSIGGADSWKKLRFMFLWFVSYLSLDRLCRFDSSLVLHIRVVWKCVFTSDIVWLSWGDPVQFDCPEVTLCSWQDQDAKIQLLTN